MQATGLRVRYFLTLTGVLFLVATVVAIMQSWMLKNERIEFVDQQVRETAAVLVDSELAGLKQINFDAAEEIISDELGENRIGKFFIIRNQAGKVLFESNSAQLLSSEQIPRSPQWVQMNIKGKYIRILNLQLPRVPDRTLQVGLVADEDIIEGKIISKQSGIILGLILFIGLAASFFSTSFLLKPIADLEKFITESHKQSRYQTLLPSIPQKFYSSDEKNNKDEFTRLVYGLNQLIQKVNKNYQFSRLWAYQMAHELKTPLSILRLEIEKIEKQNNIQDASPLLQEIDKISSTINSFLAWAELENSSQQQHLFVNNLVSTTNDIISRLFRNNPQRIDFKYENSPNIISNPQHLEQLVSNLLSNADHYSEKDSRIQVQLKDRVLIITDHGPGIPNEVLHRLGEPFNRGESKRQPNGHGLGLAWVKSICKIYGWDIQFENLKTGVKIQIIFNQDDQFNLNH